MNAGRSSLGVSTLRGLYTGVKVEKGTLDLLIWYLHNMPALRRSYTVAFKLRVAKHLIRYGNARATAHEFGVNDRQVRDWAGTIQKLSAIKKTAKQLPSWT